MKTTKPSQPIFRASLIGAVAVLIVTLIGWNYFPFGQVRQKVLTDYHDLVVHFSKDTIAGKVYPTVQYGDGPVWMQQNLDLEVSDSWYYNTPFLEDVKDDYGRLYTWQAARTACEAAGWRLPTKKEWYELTMLFSDCNEPEVTRVHTLYKALHKEGKAEFNLVTAGLREPNGQSIYQVIYGFYWTSTEQTEQLASSYIIKPFQKEFFPETREKTFGLSCRCVRD